MECMKFQKKVKKKNSEYLKTDITLDKQVFLLIQINGNEELLLTE